MFESFRIAQPRNDFSVTIADKDWKDEWMRLFAAQTTNMHINLVKCELVLGVRQLRSGIIQNVIFHLLTKDGKTVDNIRIRPAKSKEHGAEYVFVNGKLTDHESELSYDSKTVILHELTFEFEYVNLYSPGASEPIVYHPYGEQKRKLME